MRHALNYRWYARARFIERTQISLTSWNTLKINSRTNRGTSEGSETSADEYSTRRIQICVVYFCLGIIWKVILKKEVKNKFYKNRPSRSGFSSPRAFQRWSQNCRSPYGFFGNYFFVCVFLTLNPAVHNSSDKKPEILSWHFIACPIILDRRTAQRREYLPCEFQMQLVEGRWERVGDHERRNAMQ